MVKYRKILQSPNFTLLSSKNLSESQQTNKKALNQRITINSTRKHDLNNDKTLIELSQQWRSLIITNRNR